MSIEPDKTLVLDVAGVKVTLGAEPTVGQHYRTLALGTPDASAAGVFGYQRGYVAAVAGIEPAALDDLPLSEVPRLFDAMLAHWTMTGFFVVPPSDGSDNQSSAAAAAQ